MPLEQYGLLKIFNLVYRKNKNQNPIESLDEHVLTYIKKDMLLSQFSLIGEALPLEGDVDVHDLSNIGPVQTGYNWLNGRYPLPLRPSMNYLVLYSIVECLKLYGIQTWGDCLSRKRGSCFKQPPAQYFSIYSATDLRLDFSVDTNLLDIIEIEHGFSNLKKFLSAGVLQLLSEDIEEHGASLVTDLYLSQESLDAAKRYLRFLIDVLPSGGVTQELEKKHSEIRIVLFQFLKYVKENDGWNLLINSFAEDAQAHIDRVANNPHADQSAANSCLPGSSERICKLCNTIGLDSGDILPPPPNKEYALFFQELFKDEREQPNSLFSKLLINTFYGDFYWEDDQSVYELTEAFTEGTHPLLIAVIQEIRKYEEELRTSLIDFKSSQLLENYDSVALVSFLIKKEICIGQKVKSVIIESFELETDDQLDEISFEDVIDEELETLNQSLDKYRSFLEKKFRNYYKRTSEILRYPLKSLLKLVLNADLDLPDELKEYLLENNIIVPTFTKRISTEYEDAQCSSFGTMISRMKELTKLPESVILYSLMSYLGTTYSDSEKWTDFAYERCSELVSFVLNRYTPDEIPTTDELVVDFESVFLSQYFIALEEKIINQWSGIEMGYRLNIPTLEFDPYQVKKHLINDIAGNLYQVEDLTDDEGHPLDVESYLDICTQDILLLLKVYSRDRCLTKLVEFQEYQSILTKALKFPSAKYIESLWVAEPDLFSLSNFSKLFVTSYQRGYRGICFNFINVMSETADFYDHEKKFSSNDFIFTLVSDREIEVLKVLLKLEFDFNIESANKKHIIFEAIDEGGQEVFELVADSLELDVLNTVTFDGCSVLMYAIVSRELSIINYLIDREVDLETEYPKGIAMDVAVLSRMESVISRLIISNVDIMPEHFFKIVDMNQPSLIRKAISAGYELIDIEMNDRSLLVYAIEMDKTQVAELLIKKKIMPAITQTPLQTPLMAAIEKKNESLIRLLINVDDSLNLFRQDGHSAVSLAVSLLPFELFELILSKCLTNVLNPKSTNQKSPLHECIQCRGDKGRYLDALIENGALVNHLVHQKNALTVAIASEKFSMIGRLVIEGATLQLEKRTLKKFDELVITNPKWACRFLTAALNGHPSAVNRVYEVLKKLVHEQTENRGEIIQANDLAFYAAYIKDMDFLTQLDYEIALLDDNHNSLLHYAVQGQPCKETIDYLKARIDLNLRNDDDKTCIDLASGAVKKWLAEKKKSAKSRV